MSSKQERIEQCKNDIAKLQESLRELETETLIKFGDIITCVCGKRVVLQGEDGELAAFNVHGHSDGFPLGAISLSGPFYKRTGKNVFTNNLLGLNY